ncbi:CopG family ribbon-helix-helix protein [Stygiolobus caldivivus]|uniref:Nickel-responsive regulator n=1 Tax=Stygiolobus caldivivus TaxID=2824673 RepID=A0A8D5U9N3_9CREN|nr:CopG family ribbon-helix-helix protein [Stygiolobus caldivivus]BCU71423.1 nickel-responsive regulator [Stygiolobus caldivivus]
MNVEKISVSIPKELYDRLEKYMQTSGVSDRSKIMQTALRDFLDENERDETYVIGIINIVYDNESTAKVTSVQHEYENKIISVLHVHRDEKCVEAVAVKGMKSELVDLVNKLASIKGVSKVKLIVSDVQNNSHA